MVRQMARFNQSNSRRDDTFEDVDTGINNADYDQEMDQDVGRKGGATSVDTNNNQANQQSEDQIDQL